jgi:hypothetical protein
VLAAAAAAAAAVDLDAVYALAVALSAEFEAEMEAAEVNHLISFTHYASTILYQLKRNEYQRKLHTICNSHRVNLIIHSGSHASSHQIPTPGPRIVDTTSHLTKTGTSHLVNHESSVNLISCQRELAHTGGCGCGGGGGGGG